ncbi:MAG: preprotein translocase subunit SecG [Holosporales bacterium]|jgi:preprotein translocase subunit SecG|nr:preprotein translocase subunit SecG [Holosporales bacterium]
MGFLLAIHVLVTILLILIVLIQKNEGGSSLFASSGGSGMFNARGTSSVLTKATWTLASIYILNCVVMAAIVAHERRGLGSVANEPVEDYALPPQQAQSNAPPAEQKQDAKVDAATKKPAQPEQQSNKAKASAPTQQKQTPPPQQQSSNGQRAR